MLCLMDSAHKNTPAPTNCISEHLVASHGGVTWYITPDPALLPIWKDYPATLPNDTFLDLRGIRKSHSPLATTSFSIFLLSCAKSPQLVSFALLRLALFA